jgi:6-phosphogluconolactonase/glucosamine-6-phosphate isomerase/deaminase
MNISAFNMKQQTALLDLCVLGMYADGHLACSEDAQIQKLLTAMGFETPYDHQVQFDAAVTRVRQHSANWDTVCARMKDLAGLFATSQEKQQAFDTVQDLMLGDGQLSDKETRFLTALQQELGL